MDNKYLQREKVLLEQLIKMIFSHTCKNAMLSPLTRTKFEVNDEGSLHSFSIGMHGIKNLLTKCEWITST